MWSQPLCVKVENGGKKRKASKSGLGKPQLGDLSPSLSFIFAPAEDLGNTNKQYDLGIGNHIVPLAVLEIEAAASKFLTDAQSVCRLSRSWSRHC